MDISSLLFKLACSQQPVANARIAAALVYKNRVVAFGHNRYKSHPLQKRYGKNEHSIYLHAELDAIATLCRSISSSVEPSRCILYIVRAKFANVDRRSYIYGLARPCIGCMRAIAAFGINRVCYSTDNQTMEVL